MIFQRILKRSFILGLIWILGSLQYIVTANNKNIYFLLFVCCGIIGIIQCVLSCNYKRYFKILKITLVIQALYYLICLYYTITTINIMGCIIAIFLLIILTSTLYCLKNLDIP